MTEHKPFKVWEVKNRDGDGFMFSAEFRSDSILDEIRAIHLWMCENNIQLRFKNDCYLIIDPEQAALFKLHWC